jgi:hypothetical protein
VSEFRDQAVCGLGDRPQTNRGADEMLMDLLAWETKRCQRYNHFCSLLVLRCSGEQSGPVYERVRQQLRCTDVVEVVAEEAPLQEALPCRIGAILPETDARGARAAVQRLKRSLLDMRDVKAGFAVYPRDAMGPVALLEVASELVA